MRVPKIPPSLEEVLAKKEDRLNSLFPLLLREDVQEFVRLANDRYLHWDRLRFQPMPAGLDPELAWTAVLMSRLNHFQVLPINLHRQDRLHYWVPPQHHEWISSIDQKAGGHMGTRYQKAIPDDDERYLAPNGFLPPGA